MYIDSHCHLENKRFDGDRAEVFARAKAAGVETLLAIGNGDGPGTGTLDCAIKLSQQYDWVYATVGIHPHEAALAKQADFDELERLSKDSKVIAWGEIGLDYYYDNSPRDVQQRVFTQQMEMARAAKLPIIIHVRPSDNSENAWDDLLRLLREHWASSGLGGVLFNETDSPYLAPIPYRGKRNEPAYVIEVARAIAELLGIAHDEAGLQTTQNFYNFFGLQKSH